MAFGKIIVSAKGSITTITINRPERLNAINTQTACELMEAIEDCRVDRTVRAIILTGAGRAFCSGDDLKREPGEGRTAGPPDIYSALKRGYPGVVRALLEIRKPVIAAVRGYAVGAGFDISLACDFRIVAEGTQFAAIYVKRGLGGGCAYLLPRYVGLGRATEILFLGDFIDAQQALEWGLVTKVVPMDKLDAAVDELATRLANGPTGSYALIKTARNQGLGADPVKGLEYQVYANRELALLKDAKEGPAAFREKREPHYTGEYIDPGM